MLFKKILIVDDARSMQKILLKILKELGYSEILTAGNGEEALSILSENVDIDLVLSDWNMPFMQGLDLLKAVKENRLTRDIPFIMISSLSSGNDIMDAIEHGAATYIVKPFEKKTIKECIESL